MIETIKRFFGIYPPIYSLPYEQRAFIVTVSTAMERVK
jgi:hypothetical protein